MYMMGFLRLSATYNPVSKTRTIEDTEKGWRRKWKIKEGKMGEILTLPCGVLYSHVFQSQNVWVRQQLEQLDFSQSSNGELKQVR